MPKEKNDLPGLVRRAANRSVGATWWESLIAAVFQTTPGANKDGKGTPVPVSDPAQYASAFELARRLDLALPFLPASTGPISQSLLLDDAYPHALNAVVSDIDGDAQRLGQHRLRRDTVQYLAQLQLRHPESDIIARVSINGDKTTWSLFAAAMRDLGGSQEL